MFKHFNSLLLLVFLFTVPASAQNKNPDLSVYKFGKVDAADFETKTFGADSAAAAVKIFDVGKGYFDISTSTGGFVYVFERHVRYKVINKNAYDLANMEIQLYRGDSGSEEKLDFMSGATYNLVDGKVVTSKLNSEAKFSSQLDKNHIVKKFTLPNVKEGSVIEFRYKTKSEFYYHIDDWYFQDDYPCKLSYFSFEMPEYYRYKLDFSGYINITAVKPAEVSRSYYIPSTNTSSAGTVSSASMKNDYFAENIPAIKNENYITTLQDYISKIGFELTSTNFPGSGFKDFSSTWTQIVGKMNEDESFGGYLKKDSYTKALLPGIIKTENDPDKKVKLIFDFVKSNIKWDEKYSDFTKATSQRTVLEKKSGNSAEINLLLLSMLTNAGITCSPVLVSTRRNGAHPGYPLAAKFNNVIVCVQNGDTTHLLDATDKNNVSDLISYQNLNHQGLKLDMTEKSGKWISLDNKTLSRSNTSYIVKLGADNIITGTLSISSDHYEGLIKRSTYQAATNQADYIKQYKTNKPGLEISNYKIANIDQPELPFDELMDITIEDNIEDAGNLAYFMPLMFERTKENPFRLEERNFPVDFAYPTEENCRVIIEFPENYKLEKLPKSEKFKLPDDTGFFSIIYAQEGNKVSVRSKINIAKPVFTADEYYHLKELFKNIVRKQAEQIVFKKS
jgi:hypothetical protein